MSCGDCDWGCTMPGCGKQMAVCWEHHKGVVDRLQAAEDMIRRMLASAVPHPVEHPTMWSSWYAAEKLLDIKKSHRIETSNHELRARLIEAAASPMPGKPDGSREI